MCTIERFDIVYPDGRRVPRERLVNCPRGTPSRPCSNVEVRPMFDDRPATASDVNPSNRQSFHASTPGGSEGSRSRPGHRTKPVHKFEGLAISFKFWNPFKSKARKPKPKTYRVYERPRSPEVRPAIIHPLPRAPTPPPMMPRRGRSPVIVPISPNRGHRSPSPRSQDRPRSRSRERKPRPRKRREPRIVLLHQSSSSEEDKTPSPPQAARVHQRKSRSISPKSKYEAEKKLMRDREQREYAMRVAKQEQEAQRRAARVAEFERLEGARKRRERIEYDERKRIESVERARRRQQQEESERAQARRLQELEDIARLNAADRARQRQDELDRQRQEERGLYRLEEAQRLRRARRADIPRQARHQPAVHYEGESMEDRGERFIREAIRQENLRQFERRAPPNTGRPRRSYEDAGLARHNTVDGDRRWRSWERRDRRWD